MQHALYIVARPDSQFVHTCVLFYDSLCPEVQSHSDGSHMYLTAPCSVRALGQARPKMLCIYLVILSCVCVCVCVYALTLLSMCTDCALYFPVSAV